MKISNVMRWSVAGVAMAVLAALYAPMASAHGEKSQAAFLRMRTLHWIDLKWSTDRMKVNDVMELTGKVHVFSDWPETVSPPEGASFLNVGAPGPVVTRIESYLGGRFVPRSVQIERGKTYDFKLVLKARRPGDWHIHPMINVEGGGPIIGPGKWVTIEGSMADYSHEVKALTGETVDIETWKMGTFYFWTFFWWFWGWIFIWWWARRPLFLPRFIACQEGRKHEIITDADKKFGIGFMVATLVVVIFGYTSATATYPITVPLQAGVMGVMTPNPEDTSVTATTDRAEYRVPGRSIKVTITVTNNNDHPVELGEFETANVRFLNAEVLEDDTGYPANMLSEDGLAMDEGNATVGPGETRTLTFTATDAAWETERLTDIIYDPDSRFGGVLFFLGPDGQKHMVEIGGPLLPVFT